MVDSEKSGLEMAVDFEYGDEPLSDEKMELNQIHQESVEEETDEVEEFVVESLAIPICE